MRRIGAALFIAASLASVGCGRNENAQGTPDGDTDEPRQTQTTDTVTTE